MNAFAYYTVFMFSHDSVQNVQNDHHKESLAFCKNSKMNYQGNKFKFFNRNNINIKSLQAQQQPHFMVSYLSMPRGVNSLLEISKI